MTDQLPVTPAPPVIVPPPDHYSGPATGLSTEKGDSWFAAVAKINAAFTELYSKIGGGAAAVEGDVKMSGIALEDWVAKSFVSFTTFHALEDRLIAAEAKLKHYAEVIEGMPPQAATGQTDPENPGNAPGNVVQPPPPNPPPLPEGSFTAPGAGSA